ncbi:MAG: hypothetical protein KQA41_03400, partial [Candidatus Aenigmarchaeota archaeon]|nr:hypothetical protein [Candidatus Aenigmarchaeota archaeon]
PGELLEWHGHNDYYRAVINATYAWLYGCAYVNIEYTTLNPTLYIVKLSINNTSLIGFSESYDPGWEARVYKDGKKVETVKSIPLYGVINGFWINTTGENLEIVIRYKPQDYFELGLAISGITFFSCIGYLIYDWKRDFFNDKFYQLKARIKKQKYTYKTKK